MAIEFVCPTCNADLPVSGDERNGEEVHCPTCGAPSVMRGNADEEGCMLEEDY
jgi:DNA-directed RNA polymerase subunit RPC12/RpoP